MQSSIFVENEWEKEVNLFFCVGLLSRTTIGSFLYCVFYPLHLTKIVFSSSFAIEETLSTPSYFSLVLCFNQHILLIHFLFTFFIHQITLFIYIVCAFFSSYISLCTTAQVILLPFLFTGSSKNIYEYICAEKNNISFLCMEVEKHLTKKEECLSNELQSYKLVRL